jgi:hypothetical protein
MTNNPPAGYHPNNHWVLSCKQQIIALSKVCNVNNTNVLSRVDLVLTWVRTHPLANFCSRHINPFLVCFPCRAWDSSVQKWFQNFDFNFFHQSQHINRFFIDFFVFGVDFDQKISYKKFETTFTQ